jgi:glycosyltransferase involved in cell wall biosynthesis
MRILITQESDWLKRYPLLQHHVAEMMSLRGHEVRAIDYELLWRDEEKRGIRSRREVFPDVSRVYQGSRVTLIRPGIVKIPFVDYLSLLFSHRREIDHQIKEFAPDLIVGFGILNSCLAARATRGTGIPFVYYWIDVLHGLIPFRPLQPIGKAVERATLKRSDRVLANSGGLRDYVVKMGASVRRTYVVRSGINLRQFDPSVDGGSIRARYGLASGDIVLLFVGWLYRTSGLKEVALEMAREGSSGVKLLVVGDGDAYDELEGIRQRHGLHKKLILAGRKAYEEIPAFIAASDTCILPARPDVELMQHIVPIKLYEYMAMGRPVISTRLPGVVAEFGNDNGIVYVDSPHEVVARAVELAQSKSMASVGARARQFAKNLAWDTVVDEFERILEEAVGEKKARDCRFSG